MRALSKREARLVALLILIAAIGLVWLAIVQPLTQGFADRAEQKRQLINRYTANARLIAAVPRMVREAARRETALDRYVLASSDAGAAAEALRSQITAAATTVGGTFRGAEDLPPAPGVVAAHAGLRLNAEQLDRLLALLENGRPLITVTALTVGADDALVTGRATDLDVQLDLALAFRPTANRHAPAR